MLRNLRSKVLAILVLPTLIIAGLAVALVLPALHDADRASYAAQLVSRVDTSNAWTLAVASELSSTLELGVHADAAGFQRLVATRKATDTARRQYVADLTPLLHAKGASAADVAAIRAELDSVKGLDALRASLTSGKVTGSSLVDNAIAVIRAPNADLKTLIKEVGDVNLGRILTAHLDAATAMQDMQIEISSLQASYANLNSPLLTRDVLIQGMQLAPDLEQAVMNLQEDLSPAERATFNQKLDAIDMTPLNTARLLYPLGVAGQKPKQPAGWVDVAHARLGVVGAMDATLRSSARSLSASLAANKKDHAELLALVALLTLSVAFLQGLVLSRRITRPLRSLTAAAGDIARELPLMVQRMQTPGDGPGMTFAALPITGEDEIGTLAKAFNEVNETTVRVALEQAALRASIASMFVNVARRNQALLGRQLSVLERLEQHQEDPDILEDLFQIDHLTTRMQRNAESLLVLAGIDTARRSRQPLLLSDVIRTAISEIEEYPRVDLEAATDPLIDGRHVLVAAHLLAELLENATRFSDPGSRVQVQTFATPDALYVTITDHGLGMTPADVAEARHRMQLPPATEIAFSDRLGFYVVGRLARRLGAGVTVAPGNGGGTVATLALPLAVLAQQAAPAAPVALPSALAAVPSAAVALPAAPVAVAAPAEAAVRPALPAAAPADLSGLDSHLAAPEEAWPVPMPRTAAPQSAPSHDVLPTRSPAASVAAPVQAPTQQPVQAQVQAPVQAPPAEVVAPAQPMPAWSYVAAPAEPAPIDTLRALAAEVGGYTPAFASAQGAPATAPLTARTPRQAGPQEPDPLATAFGQAISAASTSASLSARQQNEAPDAGNQLAPSRDAKEVRTNLSSFRTAVQRARGDATDHSFDHEA